MVRHRLNAVDDAGAVNVRDAATIVVLRDEPAFEVLMVQRTPKAVFAPSVWVFPGGRVDPDDTDIGAWSAVVAGVSDAEASEQLGVESHGLAWWVAGVRETAEEAGLLLGATPSDHVEALIDSVRRGDSMLAELTDSHLMLDLTDITEVARFITPVGPPRRFDTRFLVARAPDGQVESVDGDEIVDARWVRPADAIDLWTADTFPMMGVTHRILACLRRYDSTSDVLTAARSRPEPRRVRVNDPDGAYEVLLPEDDGYADAEVEIEHGWVRL